MNDRLSSSIYEIKDEIIIRGDADTIRKALEAMKRIEIPDSNVNRITEPYFMGIITSDTESGEVKREPGQWLDRPEIIEGIAENTGAEIETGSNRTFRELAEDKNREVEKYRAILRAHAEAIDHITAFGLSSYAYAQKDIIKTQCMLTQTIRLTQIMESPAEIASALIEIKDHRGE